MEEFPPNSARKAAAKPAAEKNIKRVTSGPVARRKKPLMSQFQDTFMGGDARGTVNYVVFEVLIPAAKDALAEAGAQGIERLIFGETRRTGRRTSSGATGHISYNQMTTRDRPPAARLSQRERARFDFDGIVLLSREEAMEVIDQLHDILARYESVTVADLYELTGVKGSHTDQKWGWTDLRGSGVSRVRNGFLLDLPTPEPME